MVVNKLRRGSPGHPATGVIYYKGGFPEKRSVPKNFSASSPGVVTSGRSSEKEQTLLEPVQQPTVLEPKPSLVTVGTQVYTEEGQRLGQEQSRPMAELPVQLRMSYNPYSEAGKKRKSVELAVQRYLNTERQTSKQDIMDEASNVHGGEIHEHKIPKWDVLEKGSLYFEKQRQRFERSGAEGWEGVGAVGTAAGRTIFHSVRHPGLWIKDYYSLGKGVLTKPMETGRQIGIQLSSEPSSFAGTMIGQGLLFKGLGYVQAKTIDPAIAKATLALDYRYTPPEKVGLEWVESHSTPMSLDVLRSMEGLNVRTAHVTIKNPFEKGVLGLWEADSFVTQAFPEKAGKFRQEAELFHFYKSAPANAMKVKVRPSERIVVSENMRGLNPSSIVSQDLHARITDVKPYEKTLSEPQAYLGYAGIIGADVKATSERITVLRQPVITVLSFKPEKITPTPKNLRTLEELNAWQGLQSGATLIPSENILGYRIEGQFITPSKYEGIKGYEGFLGSVIEKTGKIKRTIYEQKLENPYKNPVSKMAWDVFGVKSKYHKIKVVEVRTKPVTEGLVAAEKPMVFNIKDYNIKSYRPATYSTPRYGDYLSGFYALASYKSFLSKSSVKSSLSSMSSPRKVSRLSNISISNLSSSSRMSIAESFRSITRSRPEASYINSFRSSSNIYSGSSPRHPFGADFYFKNTKKINPPPKPPVLKISYFSQRKKSARKRRIRQSSFKPVYTADVTSTYFDIKGFKPSKLSIMLGLPRPKTW